MVPWEEQINATAVKSESPPPTFASATARANGLTDQREVINDSSQDIWSDDFELRSSTSVPDSRATTPSVDTRLNFPPTGPLRTRVPHGMPGDQIEMISAPVQRR